MPIEMYADIGAVVESRLVDLGSGVPGNILKGSIRIDADRKEGLSGVHLKGVDVVNWHQDSPEYVLGVWEADVHFTWRMPEAESPESASKVSITIAGHTSDVPLQYVRLNTIQAEPDELIFQKNMNGDVETILKGTNPSDIVNCRAMYSAVSAVAIKRSDGQWVVRVHVDFQILKRQGFDSIIVDVMPHQHKIVIPVVLG